MSGEETTPDTGDSGSTTDAAQAPTTENWEQRFKDNQTAFHKSQQDLKAEREIWDDEEALFQRLQERYPDWVAGDEEPVVEEAPAQEPSTIPHDPRLDAALPVLEQLQAAEAERTYQNDLKELLGDRKLDPKGAQFVRAMCAQGGDNHQALKGAVEQWFELFPVEEEQPERKRASAVIAAGHMTEDGKPDWSKMSDAEVDAYMAAEVIARSQQT